MSPTATYALARAGKCRGSAGFAVEPICPPWQRLPAQSAAQHEGDGRAGETGGYWVSRVFINGKLRRTLHEVPIEGRTYEVTIDFAARGAADSRWCCRSSRSHGSGRVSRQIEGSRSHDGSADLEETVPVRRNTIDGGTDRYPQHKGPIYGYDCSIPSFNPDGSAGTPTSCLGAGGTALPLSK